MLKESLLSTCFEVSIKDKIKDRRSLSLKKEMEEIFDISIDHFICNDLYWVNVEFKEEDRESFFDELFKGRIDYQLSWKFSSLPEDFFQVIVHPKAEVTDPVGKSLEGLIEGKIGRSLSEVEGVCSGKRYLFKGVSQSDIDKLTKGFLMNSIIEKAVIKKGFFNVEEYSPFSDLIPIDIEVKTFSFDQSDEVLMQLNKDSLWALSIEEIQAIRSYYHKKGIAEERIQMGLGADPTDVELEAIAQTWSEHCHHKVFNANISYTDPLGELHQISSIFKTYIKQVTKELNSSFLVSVFHDNAGVVAFHPRYHIVYKVETHNSPSALDPYGGAMTGIVGVDRDVLGTGRGAELLAHVKLFCLADPFNEVSLPSTILPPRRIRQGVHRGVIDGGNQSGVPLMRGRELFDSSYIGKPLVFCGSLGRMSPSVGGKKTHEKNVVAGDLVVMAGGRVGKDGIHGATFSSIPLSDSIPNAVVQIGDPITQKRLGDFIKEALAKDLYRTLTDNGAGGLSSSAGEMALLSGGLEIDLKEVPLKYKGLQPWEIYLSEAQERMTFAVPKENWESFSALAKKRGVEVSALGTFTKSGKIHIRYNGKSVAYLDINFLHFEDPPYQLEATWNPPFLKEPEREKSCDLSFVILQLLGSLNIASKEDMLRQYDQEVKGLSVIKPLVGVHGNFISDSSVMLVDHEGYEGVILSEGINPFYSQIDTYHMATSVVDEGVRRAISVGGKMGMLAGLDNFCWPNVVDSSMPNRSHKLAQLVRANQGLYAACKAFRIPLISGKDSMSNDCTQFTPPVSVLPTLLFSVLGEFRDVRNSVTMDMKVADDLIYIIGLTYNELGGSEFYRYKGKGIGKNVPKVNFKNAIEIYNRMSVAIENRWLHSSHALGKGGLGIGLALSACAGEIGASIDLSMVPVSKGGLEETILFSESNSRFLVTLPSLFQKEFEALFEGVSYAHIGYTTSRSTVEFNSDKKCVCKFTLKELIDAYQGVFKEGE